MTHEQLHSITKNIQQLEAERDHLIRDLHTQGETVVSLARATGLSRQTIYNKLKGQQART